MEAKFEFFRISELAGIVVNCTCKLDVTWVTKLRRAKGTPHTVRVIVCTVFC